MRIRFFALAALALLLGACTQDEAGFLPEGAEGTPIVFTATGLNPVATATAGTRAPVDGNWEGVQSVAVLMDGTVKTYNVTPSTAAPTSATLTSTDPYYWTNHKDITVTAWWPYTAGETTPPAVKVKANQSAQKDFEGSDLIVADGQKVTYGSPTLRFTHRTARVTIVLTDYTEGLASVQLTGLSTENGNPDIIVPYDKGSNTYTAIVAPQSVAAGTTFITCTFTNGKTFVYKMKNAADWLAGDEYTYTVSLAAAKDLGYTIESDGSYTVTSADGLMNIAELVNGGKTDINITLDKNIDLTGKGWTPIGTSFDNSYKGTFDGGGHTITGLAVTTNDQFVGLFGYLNRAGTVKNVVMEGIQITSNHMFGCTGGVVGYSWGTIENCSVSGSVSGTDCVGGVVGSQKAGSIIGCSSSATVKGTHYVGGVAGEKWGTMIACYATGNVTLEIGSPKNLSGGGVVGLNGGSRVLACYAIGNVNSKGSSTGNVHIGGLFGDNYTVVTACYWKNNQEQGIGRNQHNTAPEATKVDGTDVTWQKAVDAMNTALQNAGSGWRYELNGALPTLRKL
ncbi:MULTISPECIES: fimbrillin family protein [Bacteroidales]|uniref:fimbrillin family protein n=1 Tax=Bacteroidales TaxID=171549 RepID=UPI001C37A9B3|nr:MULTISPECIES: fimbrillin family protein [unclassified Bacteroides]MBV3660752.1 fimbrillin family protein [Bacteroides sp. MSK.18.91]MBV3671344.1 fimbrillin family protein [Bacteroides sp. MSK.18.83]MBV3715744.1 fimbrillin family protein [Bacteroides sp. MSK.18.39]MBV3742299.1 fimbrillin family protein [Bacteroides sp. MSK.18.37]MBV3757925.1 fimbrillin family protein [Bacteroides sp. MSK.18.22]